MLFFPLNYIFVWHALPATPEQIAKIVATNHMGDITIETNSQKKFQCNIYHKKECWTEHDTYYKPINLGKTLCLGDCLDKHTLHMMRSSYEVLFFARPSILYSLHDDGIIYVKRSGIILWPGYVMGAVFGSFCAFVVFLSNVVGDTEWKRPLARRFWRVVDQRRTEGLSKMTDNDEITQFLETQKKTLSHAEFLDLVLKMLEENPSREMRRLLRPPLLAYADVDRNKVANFLASFLSDPDPYERETIVHALITLALSPDDAAYKILEDYLGEVPTDENRKEVLTRRLEQIRRSK